MPSLHCRICKRILKNPVSIELGIGLVCRAKNNLQEEFDFMKEKVEVKPIEGFEDVVCKPDGTTNVPHRIVHHSPTGLAWGYGGSGPADLALNALAAYIGSEEAKLYYQDFKWKFIAVMPEQGGTIKREEIMNWIEEKRKMAGVEV
jgi:hypothetical protein